MSNRANATLADVAKAISEPKRYLVAAHYNPDADAHGSACAMMLALRARGADAVLLNETPLHERYVFIPGAKEAVTTIPSGKFDAAIILDCGTLERVGDKLKDEIRRIKPIINIDHHVSNDFFGDLNLIDESASSTSEMVYRILSELKFNLTPQVATSLLTGIYGDTGSFRHASTKAGVFNIAAKLVESGADPHSIAKSLFGSNSVSGVKLQAEAMRTMEYYGNNRIAEIVVTQKMLDTFGASREDVEELSERARDIKGVDVAVLIREEGNLWKLSLRSTAPKYDVSNLASQFGGGGHKVAAGFRWRRSLDELKKELRPKLESLVKS